MELPRLSSDNECRGDDSFGLRFIRLVRSTEELRMILQGDPTAAGTLLLETGIQTGYVSTETGNCTARTMDGLDNVDMMTGCGDDQQLLDKIKSIFWCKASVRIYRKATR